MNLVASGLPAGVTATWSPNPTQGTSTLTLTASSTAALTSKTVTVVGTSGALTASTTSALAVVPPAFTLSGIGSVTVAQGTSATSGIYVLWQNGFSANVNLSVSGLPSGVTVSFSPASTSSFSTVTLTASSTASLGQYNATITATYGKQIWSLPINVTVAASLPGFTISEFGNLQVGRGSSMTSSIYLNRQTGFNASVQLSAVGLPSGVSASFLPNPTIGASVMTLTATNTASLGEYNATIVGTSGKQTASVPIAVSVYSPSFTLNSYQGAVVCVGGSAQATISVLPSYGFIGSVNLSVSGLPSGVTASFLPNPTADQSTLTVNAGSNVTPGQYTLTITGVSGKQTATTTMPLTINAPSFTIWSPGGLSIGRGQSVPTFVALYPQNGFNKPVQLTASGLPPGVTASFSPNPAATANSTQINSTLTLTASSSAAAGEYNVTVTGTGGGQSAATQIPVTVGAPSFTVWGPSLVSLGQGTSIAETVSMYSQFGFTNAVKFSVTGLPAGVVASFSPNPTTGSSTLTLNASGTAAAGQYYATIVGTSGTQSATAPFILIIGPPSFTLGISNNVAVAQGQSATTNIWIYQALGLSGQVNFTISGLPAGVSASFSPEISATGTTLTVSATSTASAGTYAATVTGTSGTTKATAALTITVGVQGFSVSSFGSVQLGQGSSSQSYVYVSPTFGSATPSVTLSASGLPSGMTASFSTNPTTYTSLLTLAATASVATGTYTITVSGTSGTQHASTTLQVVVSAPTFTLSSSGYVGIGQGSSATTNIYEYAQYGFSGNVQYAISGLPSGVTGTFSPNPSSTGSTLTLSASSTAALGQYNATVTGTSGKQTASAIVTTAVYAPTFTLASYGSMIVGRGTSATGYIYVSPQYGFSGNIQFAASGMPSGVTATFSPNPGTTTTVMTLTASSTAGLGDYKFTVTGKSGSQIVSTVATVGIYVPTFTVSNSGNVNIGQGTSTTTYINLLPEYGFAGNVHFAVYGLPGGVTASFSPNPTTNGSVLTLTALATASLGQYTLTVTGTSGALSASTTFVLGVYVPTFTIAYYGGVAIGQGTTSTAYVYVYPQYGFNGPVHFAASGLPKGVTASFSPNPTTTGSTTFKLTASSTAALGQYDVTITGTSGTQTASTTLTLGVFVPTFALSDGFNVTLSPGGSGQSYVYITDEYGFSGDVQLAVSGMPSGVTASFSPNPATTNSTLTVTAGSTVIAGQYTLTITGSSGSQKASTTVALTIN